MWGEARVSCEYDDGDVDDDDYYDDYFYHTTY